jgi:hypothetical protein
VAETADQLQRIVQHGANIAAGYRVRFRLEAGAIHPKKSASRFMLHHAPSTVKRAKRYGNGGPTPML